MATRLEQNVSDIGWYGAGAMERLSGAFRESFEALLLEPSNPFVPGLAADSKPTAYFSDGIEIPCAVGDEEESLVHG